MEAILLLMNSDQPQRSTRGAGQTVRRIGGRLHRVVPVLDSAGKLLQYAISPLKVELRRRDLIQIIVGASLLGVPLGLTEETWSLAAELPTANVLAIAAISVVFVSAYVHFNFYRELLWEHLGSFLLRVASIYLLSLIVVGLILSLLDRAPWLTDPLLAIKRTLLVSFPATMSASISDAID